MRKVTFGATWKMNKTLAEAVAYADCLKQAHVAGENVAVFVVAPFTHLCEMRAALDGSGILLGAQNMHWADAGAFTGEISPVMLREIGVDVVELGHSERRQYFNETDYTVNQKVLAALAHGLTPLVCVGEHRAEREYGVANEVVARQVKIALHGVPPEQCGQVWIAYEPVWAIGEGGTPAEPSVAAEMHVHIRRVLVGLYGRERGELPPILYGGSVSRANAADLLSQPAVDGLFLSRAALDPNDFVEIIAAAAPAV